GSIADPHPPSGNRSADLDQEIGVSRGHSRIDIPVYGHGCQRLPTRMVRRERVWLGSVAISHCNATRDERQQLLTLTGLFLLRLAGWLALAERQGLFERLAHFGEALVVEVMDALVALGAEVDQFDITTHVSDSLRSDERSGSGAVRSPCASWLS